MTRTLRLALLVPAAALLAAAGRPPHYVVEPGSRFWIDGTSTLGRYTCAAGGVEGHGDVGAGAARVEAEVRVPVGAFDCGQPRMNRDFRQALRAAAHPAIRFRLNRAETLGREPRPGAWVRVRAAGTIQMAGVERAVAIDAEGQRLAGGRVRIRGAHALRMTDFDVTPPSGLLGLVRAHDGVTVRFDLTAAER
jgi:hypothetical protein